MAEPAQSPVRLVGRLRAPVYSRALALILSSASTGVLGLLYWTLAARLYGAHDLGINAALISTMMFLSYVSQLSLAGALPRFIPTAGRHTTRLVLGSYGVAVLAAAALASVFVLGVGVWAPGVRSLLDTPLAIAWFLVATMAWSIFALQDATLTGLGRAVWVPAENTIFAVVKILVLIALASSIASAGIYVSWTVPAALSVIPINLMIFRWFLPSHLAQHGKAEPEGDAGLIGRYVFFDFGGSLLVSASTGLLPLIVLATAGANASAYYYAAWTIVYSLQLFSASMAVSLSVEARQRAEIGMNMRRMLRLLVGLQLPLVVIVGIFAPLILQLFGSEYSSEGALLLRLLALGVLPHGLNAVCLGLARVRSQFRLLFAIQGAQAVLFVALTFIFLRALGIAGVGIAFLATQSAVAVPVFITQVWPLIRANPSSTPTADQAAPSVSHAGPDIGGTGE